MVVLDGTMKRIAHISHNAKIKTYLITKIHDSTIPTIIDEYVGTSTIHGVPLIFKPKQNLISRLMWIGILFSCFSVCLYEMVNIYADYKSNPSVIQLSPFKPASYPYPSVRYCPKSWINFTKVEELEIDEYILIYALSLLHQIIIPNSQFNRFFMPTNFSDADEELSRLIEKYRWKDYLQFYVAIAKDADAVVRCGECKTSSAPLVATSIGVCYDLDFKDYPWDTRYYADRPCVGFTAIPADNESDIGYHQFYDTIFATDVVYIGEHRSDFFGWDPLFLSPHLEHTIKIRPTLKQNLPRNDSICLSKPPDDYSDKMCGTECAEQIYGPNCWKAYHLGHIKHDQRLDDLRWCSTLDSNHTCQDRKCEHQYMAEVRKCAAKCYKPCIIWEFDKSVQMAGYCQLHDTNISKPLSMGGSRVEFVYLAAEGTLLDELPIMSANIFISNMGCQIGLWFGGSAVSLWQLWQLVMKLFLHLTSTEIYS